jgi:hypothetical protein
MHSMRCSPVRAETRERLSNEPFRRWADSRSGTRVDQKHTAPVNRASEPPTDASAAHVPFSGPPFRSDDCAQRKLGAIATAAQVTTYRVRNMSGTPREKR